MCCGTDCDLLRSTHKLTDAEAAIAKSLRGRDTRPWRALHLNSHDPTAAWILSCAEFQDHAQSE
jgi:hypothetical protein